MITLPTESLSAIVGYGTAAYCHFFPSILPPIRSTSVALAGHAEVSAQGRRAILARCRKEFSGVDARC